MGFCIHFATYKSFAWYEGCFYSNNIYKKNATVLKQGICISKLESKTVYFLVTTVTQEIWDQKNHKTPT